MQNTCPSCYSCGMPLEKPEDYALNDANQTFCAHCIDSEGRLKPYEEIANGVASWLMHSQGLNESIANKMAKEILEKQPAWKGRV